MAGITKLTRWTHAKASEEYVGVRFEYDGFPSFEWAIPIVYPRLGLELTTDAEIDAHLEAVYAQTHPDNHEAWREAQANVWQASRSDVTKPIFEAFVKDFSWLTYSDLPGGSSNAARRLQALKELGYTVATRKGAGKSLEYMILPIPRGAETGYEWWSGALRNRIAKVLKSFDSYEGKPGITSHLLPDHKFPEVRWDADTRRETLDHLTDEDIARDFQLITNQRNQQKREVCRRCYQTGKRGYPFGISHFYAGDEDWPANIPKTGKAAEAGCVGCGWYDLQAWRNSVSGKLSS